MKYKGCMLSVILGLITVITATTRSFPFGFSQEETGTVNLQTFLICDFGNDVDLASNIVWNATFSKFAKPADPSVQLSPPDTNACAVTYVEAKPLGLPVEVESKIKWCLGIKSQFTKKGYNYIELWPKALSNSPGSGWASNQRPNPYAPGTPTYITLRGIVKSLDVWVWGGNYKYSLEFYLQDYKGFLHRLPAGYISYIGWKNLRTGIPSSISQAANHVPLLKPLKLTMIKFWADPEERVDQFYCYLDYLQVQTDVYEERFNGDDLANLSW